GRRSTPDRSPLRIAVMPTCRLRRCARAIFSGYTDANGLPVVLTDPTTGNPIPNNNLVGLMALNPAAAKAGQAMLNFLPLPDIRGQPGVAADGCVQDAQFASQRYQRNYYWSFNETHPRRNDIVRIDYNPTSRLTTWVRYINDYDLDTTRTFGGLQNSQGQREPLAIDHPNPRHGYGVGMTYTISPTLVNESRSARATTTGRVTRTISPNSIVRRWAIRRRLTTSRPIRSSRPIRTSRAPVFRPAARTSRSGF